MMILKPHEVIIFGANNFSPEKKNREIHHRKIFLSYFIDLQIFESKS